MISPCEFPGSLFSVAGFYRGDFDSVVRRTGAEPSVSDIKVMGEKIDRKSTIYLQLPCGRFAALTKRGNQSEIEIGLQRIGRVFFEGELNAVARFVGFDSDYIEKYANPPIEWAKERPSEAELVLWQDRVGSPYPY